MPRVFDVFCDTVCAQIRARADRGSIRAELTAHLEDHADALMAQGLDSVDAARQAVAAMGDPEELGRSLDRLHPVWPEALRTLVWTAFCLMLALLFFTALPLWPQFRERWSREELAFDTDARSIASSVRAGAFEADLTLYPGGPSVQVRDYTLQVTRSLLVDDGGRTLFFELSAHWSDPWLKSPNFPGGLSAQDSLGTSYAAYAWGDGPPTFAVVDLYDDGQPTGLCSACLVGRVSQVSAGAEWVALTYDHGGTSFTLRIPLEGGVPYDG